MLHVRSLLVAGLGFAAFVACSSTPGGSPTETPDEAGTTRADGGDSDDADEDAPLVTPPGQVSIRVDQARMTSSSALQLSVTVGIGVGGGALPLDPNFFSLKTDDGVLHSKPTSSAQTWWVDGTSPLSTAKLLPGESFKNWRLTFSDVTYGGAAPTELIIKAPSGDVNKPILTATTSVSLEKCSSCDAGTCTYLDRDVENCGKCGMERDNLYGVTQPTACVRGVFQCASALSLCVRGNEGAGQTLASCADLQTDRDNCGSCGSKIPYDTRCSSGKPVCADSSRSMCDGMCVNLASDNRHCGACGVRVPNGASCVNGTPVCNQRGDSLCSNSCVDLKDDRSNCGACGSVCASGKSCTSGVCATPVTASSPWSTGGTCDDVCSSRGMTCAGPTYGYAYSSSGGGYTNVEVKCGSYLPGYFYSGAYSYQLTSSINCLCK